MQSQFQEILSTLRGSVQANWHFLSQIIWDGPTPILPKKNPENSFLAKWNKWNQFLSLENFRNLQLWDLQVSNFWRGWENNSPSVCFEQSSFIRVTWWKGRKNTQQPWGNLDAFSFRCFLQSVTYTHRNSTSFTFSLESLAYLQKIKL